MAVFVKTSSSCYELVNAATDQRLAVRNNDAVLEPAGGPDPAAQWILSTTGDGTATFVNAGSGRLLDVVGQATADGSPVNTWTPNSGANQRWAVLAAGADPSGGIVTFTAGHSGKCADVVSAATADGAEIAQYPYHGGTNQRWDLQDAGGGYVRLVAQHSGKCLDVEGGSTADGARVLQWAYHSGSNQQWQLQGDGSGNGNRIPPERAYAT